MVVHHRLAQGGGRQGARRADHFFSQPAARRRRPCQPLRAAAAALRACGARRSGGRRAAARPARRARRLRARPCRGGPHRGRDRRLVAQANRERLRGGGRGARIPLQPPVRRETGGAAPGRARLQPQRAEPGAGELLLQPAASRGHGSVVIGGRELEVSGEAWLDHEWSSEALAEEAVGWDWIGINLADGGALMAFRVRSGDGSGFWAGGTLRGADGRVRTFKPGEVRLEPLRRWRSPRTGTEYPVSVRVQASALTLEIEPLMEDQELDARASTGTVYWEGAVRARAGEKEAGRGYLELTGYWKPLKL